MKPFFFFPAISFMSVLHDQFHVSFMILSSALTLAISFAISFIPYLILGHTQRYSELEPGNLPGPAGLRGPSVVGEVELMPDQCPSDCPVSTDHPSISVD